jgi:hypothetical protein
MTTVYIDAEVEVDVADVLRRVDDDDCRQLFLDRLANSGSDIPGAIEPTDWQQLYELLAAGRRDEAIEKARDMAQAATGRLLP